jgi:hypothetical protein
MRRVKHRKTLAILAALSVTIALAHDGILVATVGF